MTLARPAQARPRPQLRLFGYSRGRSFCLIVVAELYLFQDVLWGRMGGRSWLASIALLGVITPASAQTFSGIVLFGDSATDNGRYLYLPKIAGDPTSFATVGPHTTSPDPMYS